MQNDVFDNHNAARNVLGDYMDNLQHLRTIKREGFMGVKHPEVPGTSTAASSMKNVINSKVDYRNTIKSQKSTVSFTLRSDKESGLNPVIKKARIEPNPTPAKPANLKLESTLQKNNLLFSVQYKVMCEVRTILENSFYTYAVKKRLHRGFTRNKSRLS